MIGEAMTIVDDPAPGVLWFVRILGIENLVRARKEVGTQAPPRRAGLSVD